MTQTIGIFNCECHTLQPTYNMSPANEETKCEDTAVIDIPREEEQAPHPLLDKSGKTHVDELEREDNMVVIVPFDMEDGRGVQRYRVDFEKNSEEYQMMPREIKKVIVLRELTQKRDEMVAQRRREEEYKRLLQRLAPDTYNQQQQQEKKEGMIARLRAKLFAKNPVKYKDVMNNVYKQTKG